MTSEPTIQEVVLKEISETELGKSRFPLFSPMWSVERKEWQEKADKMIIEKFNGLMPPIPIILNDRNVKNLRGRYHDGFGNSHFGRKIELFAKRESTLLHELIHYYLSAIGRPHGHTSEFKAIAKHFGLKVGIGGHWKTKFICRKCQIIMKSVDEVDTQPCMHCGQQLRARRVACHNVTPLSVSDHQVLLKNMQIKRY